jgi:hypothetical protein
MPEKWDDHSLDQKFTGIDRTLQRQDDVLTAVAALPHSVGVLSRDLERLTNESREALEGVRAECKAIREEYKQANAERAKNRTTITVAVIAGCFTVMAALITALTAVVTST